MEQFKLPNVEEEKSILKTLRLKASLLKRVEKVSQNSNLSVNRIINECIEYALDNLNQTEQQIEVKKEN